MAKTKKDMIKLMDFQDLMEHIYSAKKNGNPWRCERQPTCNII